MKASMIDDSVITGELPPPRKQQRPNPSGMYQQPQPQRNTYTTPQFNVGYGSIHSTIRKGISDLFPNFYMTKTQQYNDPNYGVYGIYKARVGSLTIGPTKYLVAFVNNDQLPIGSQKLLNSLGWTNFQTRETDNPQKEFGGMQLQEQFSEMKDNPILMERIQLQKESKYSYVYRSDNLPIKIELMPTSEDDQFAPEGTIASALSLFTTSLTLE